MDWGLLSGLKSNDPLGLSDKPIEDKVKAIVTAPPDDEEIKMLLDHMHKIEKDFDGISNIPPNHLYYDLRHRIQQIQNK